MSRYDQLLALLQESPDDVFLHYGLSMELIAQGDLIAARTKLEEIAVKWPDYLAAYYQLGQLAIGQNNIELAKKWLNAGVELAKKQNNKRTLSELNSALDELS